MDPRRPLFDAWPLLPRPADASGRRPVDEPARAAVIAALGLGAVLLLLRLLVPDGGLTREFAKLLALIGCKLSLTISAALLTLLVGAALTSPLPIHPALRRLALLTFDHCVHLALVLSVAGILGVIVLHGGLTRVAGIFTVQALLLVACYRARTWIGRGSPA